ncbi:MAG TPA: ATP-binding protein, partial [Desulfobacterales bacterium]|nr:ATP-binding protein [Desulfobacterales bacterium]
TSKDQAEDAVAALDAGADDYIKKPFNPDELKARIIAGKRIIELEDNQKKANAQLFQSEKMASIGQLAAGVAHEINNPTGFVSSNLKTLTDYQNDLNNLIKHYRKLITDLKEINPENLSSSIEKQLEKIGSLEEEADIDFILEDIMDLISDCKEGSARIKKIVIDLKDFAHPGEDKIQSADINHGIETTLNVVWNELKYNATVNKKLGKLPMVKCYPQQLNQVFMNLFVNAAQAIEKQGEISISTRADNGFVEIKIGDTGSGIDKENLSRIFDPFFTTKDVGKGTGMGLNVAYNIIKKHKGTIDVKSQVGRGTVFKIRIPAEN